MQTAPGNLVLGRGKLYFDQFVAGFNPTIPGGASTTGELYFGNTTTFEISQAQTDLKHYSSDYGTKELDASVTIQRDMTGQFATDNIAPENLAIWYQAAQTAYEQAPTESAATEDKIVIGGRFYQVGVSDGTPMGLTDLATLVLTASELVHATGTLTFAAQMAPGDTITLNGIVLTAVAEAPAAGQFALGGNAAGTAQSFANYVEANIDALGVSAAIAADVVTVEAVVGGTPGNAYTLAKSGASPTLSAATLTGGATEASETLTAGTDYIPDLPNGRYQIIPSSQGGGVADNSLITVSYTLASAAGQIIVSQDIDLYGAIRFVADNAQGADTDHYYPCVRIVSQGNYALKGDAWQTMSFSIEVLKLPNRERSYLRQRAD